MSKCPNCGMPLLEEDYHPYAACLMFKTCGDADVVRANLAETVDYGSHTEAARRNEMDAVALASLALEGIETDSVWAGIDVMRKMLAEQRVSSMRYGIVRNMSAQDFADARATSQRTGVPLDYIIDDIGEKQAERRFTPRKCNASGPTFDSYGDPTDETLNRIRGWQFDFAANRPFDEFLEFVKEAWNLDYGAIREEDPNLVLVTGGWSSNESVIGAVRGNYMFNAMRWVSSSRGGAHIYRMA